MNTILTKVVPTPLTRAFLQVVADERGAVTMIYSIMLVSMLLALGIGMDVTNALQAKAQLDLAADAGAIACAEDWQATMSAGAASATTATQFTDLETNANNQAQQVGKNTFAAQAAQLGAEVSTGYPTVATVNNSVTGAKGATVTCTVAYQASVPTYLMRLAHFTSMQVSSTSKSNVELTPYVSVYLILDTSASMMVGSTPADQSKVANWVAAQPSNSVMNNSGGDTTPCAYACHDSTPFTVSNLQQGETKAASLGATTRFDIMKLALVNDPSAKFCGGSGQIACNAAEGEGLLAYIRDNFTSTKARANLNTFVYSMFGFNEGIKKDFPDACIMTQDVADNSQNYIQNQAALATVATAINGLTIGLNTHLNPPARSGHTAVLDALVNTIVPKVQPAPAPGLAASNPLIFVIIVTDGLNSDRNWNWGGTLNGCDTPPGTVTKNPSITAANYCNLWKANATSDIPLIDGTLSWQGNGGNQNGQSYGTMAECFNNLYSPGFLAAPIAPATSTASAPSANRHSWYDGYFGTSQYVGPIQTSYCTTLKNNGATVAILETPYVPLTGQDPGQDFPYENTVQNVIYPSGDPATHLNTQSAVSAALQSCATSQNYYFSAVSDAAIASGFIQLFNTYVGQWVHLTQ